MAAGLDSLGSVEFVNVLSRRLHLPLPATLIFDHPTAAAVSQYLHAKLSAAAKATETYTDPHTAADSIWAPDAVPWTGDPSKAPRIAMPASPRAVAVLATAEQPLQAAVLQASCASAAICARDAITCIPISRWDAEDTAARGSAPGSPRFGAFMQGVELFDVAAFGLSAAEARITDPQHRLLLQLTGETLYPIPVRLNLKP